MKERGFLDVEIVIPLARAPRLSGTQLQMGVMGEVMTTQSGGYAL